MEVVRYEYINDRLGRFEGVPAHHVPVGPVLEGNTLRELMSLPTGENADMRKFTRWIFGCEEITPPEPDESEEPDLLQLWADELGLEPEDFPEEPPLPAPADFEEYAARRRA